jgi:cellulose synthase (UDP-forming)
VYLDEGEALATGMPVNVVIDHDEYRAELTGSVTDVTVSRGGSTRTQTIEILDFNGSEYEYLQILYDRLPTLPHTLSIPSLMTGM